ncbi:MAG: hypothetical protein HYV59_04300 [Planctomycetes bacterium]|nr:hypothetical protein [Planctomycetota bacterium]
MKMGTFYSFRNLSIVSLISTSVCVLLMFIRVWHAFSFFEPLQLTTSGWEEEDLYAMWKYIKGMGIYTDRYSVPYAASVYNWLFYQSYGFIIKNIISLFSLNTSWIPTIGRFFTLAGALFGVFICYASFIQLSEVKNRTMSTLAFSFSLLTFLGPLVGFWAFTVRPDVWSFVFEVTGIFFFWKYYSRNKIKAIFFAAIALYCSWAFKQSGFLTVVAILVFLIIKKDFKAFFMFSLLMIIFYFATFLLGDKEYVDTILYHGEREFSINLAIRNILKATSKSSPAIISLISSIVFIIFCKGLKRGIIKNDNVLFAAILFFTTIVIVFPASAMEGAADNYCFMVLYASSLLAITLVSEISGDTLSAKDGGLRVCIGFMIFGWIANVISIMMVFMGYQGVISVYPQHIDMVKKQKCIENLPKPLFVDNMYLSLPWMNPSEPYVFTNWFYRKERELGISFNDGGIGGLIKKGHYRTLLFSNDLKTFDGAELSEYKILPEKCEGFYVYIKN